MPPGPTRMNRSHSKRASPYPQVPPPPSPPPFLRGYSNTSASQHPYPPLPRRRPHLGVLPCSPASPPVLTSTTQSSHAHAQGAFSSSSSSSSAAASYPSSPFSLDAHPNVFESSSSTSAEQRAGETCLRPLAPGSPSAHVLLQFLHRAREELENVKRELASEIKGKRELLEEFVVTKGELDAAKGELALAQEENAKYAKSVRDVREETSCGICGHQMTSSVLLECGHSFCASCVYAWFKTMLEEHTQEYRGYDPRGFIPDDWMESLHDEDLPWLVRFTIISKVDAALLKAAHPYYTCPTCRQRIKSTPVPNVALKQVARHLDESGEESDANGPADSAHWQDLFPFNIRALELR